MVGTLYNTAAVLVGSSIGIALGRHIPSAIQQSVFVALGLFTLALGGLMALEMQDPFAIFLALVVGAMAGEGLRIHDRLTSRKSAHTPGWIQASLLFCAGAMTVIGCMEDGLAGDPAVLLIKGTMDLVSSIFLAAALGRGVIASALVVLIVQGGLTLAFLALGPVLSEGLITELGALGGVLLLALALDLLGLREIRLLNLLPALVLLPLMLPVSEWVRVSLPGWWAF